MGVAIAIVIGFIIIGIFRSLFGAPPSRSKSDRYHDRDYW